VGVGSRIVLRSRGAAGRIPCSQTMRWAQVAVCSRAVFRLPVGVQVPLAGRNFRARKHCSNHPAAASTMPGSKVAVARRARC